MAITNLHDLFETKLQVMLAAERRIMDMLEEAESETQEPKLREAFAVHRAETQKQVERIQQVFESLGRRARNVDPSVVEGLFEEKRRFVREDPTPEVLDLFNLSGAVKTEHIEIAGYEELILLAEQMGAPQVADPLRKNLQEEQATLEKMTRFAREGTVKPTSRATAEQAAR